MNRMIRSILLIITICLSFSGFSQTLGLKRYKTDTTLIYQKDVKLYEFVLENKKQGLFWDTLKSDAFVLTKFKVKNNTGEIIVLKNVRQDDGTITFFSDSPDKIIYPDSSVRVKMISGRRLGPFTSTVRITYMKGKEEKQSAIPTWGYYGTPYKQELSNKLPVVPAEKKPVFVPPPIQTIVHEPKPPVKNNAAIHSVKKEFFMYVMNQEENITADTYIIHNQDTVKSSFYDKQGSVCFQLKVSPTDVWPVKFITKHHGIYKTAILFYKIPLTDNAFSIYLPKEGELSPYTGIFTKLHEDQTRKKALGDSAFKKDYFITLISGTDNITADSYLFINGKKIRSSAYGDIGMCFKLRAKPTEAWPVRIVTKKHGSYNTTIFFNREIFCIRIPNAGEKYRYSGSSIMLNNVYKGYYFIKAPTTDDYRAIKDILEKRGSLQYDIHDKFVYDRIRLPNDSAAAAFEKELRAKGIKATLEPVTEWRGDMWEMENGKAVNVAKAYVTFNAGTTEQWVVAMLKRFGNVTFAGPWLSNENKEEFADCPAYQITVHSNLYKEYMAVFDKLWNMKEVKRLEQLHVDEAD